MARNSLKNVCRLIQKAKEELPPEQSFLMDLKRSIELSNMSSSRAPSKTYKPSSMNCMRSMYYQVIGAKQDEESQPYTLVGICNSGSDIHVRIQTAIEGMKKNGFDCEYLDVEDFIKFRHLDSIEIRGKVGVETKLYHKDLNMSFMTDGIIRYGKHYYILELKTETSNKWFSRTDVDPKHHNQATAYSIAFGLPEVLFIYISRDTLDMKAFLMRPTDEQKSDLVGRIDTCDRYVSKLEVPPIPFDVSKSTCTYCSYRSQCRKDG